MIGVDQAARMPRARATWRDSRHRGSRATSVQDLGRVSQPIPRDLVFELRVRADLLPPALRELLEGAGAELVVFEDCSHAPIYENVPAFNARTLAFQQRHSG